MWLGYFVLIQIFNINIALYFALFHFNTFCTGETTFRIWRTSLFIPYYVKDSELYLE